MKKLLKWLVILAVVGVGLAAFSYVAARASVGQILGREAGMLGQRTMTFLWDGAPVPGRPKAWMVRYAPATPLELQEFRIYVSVTGEYLGASPEGLMARVEAWQRMRADRMP